MYRPGVLYEADSSFGEYVVADTIYNGRSARVLYNGNRLAAMSGIALDDNPEMLFDYNQKFLKLVQPERHERILLIGGGVYTFPMAVLQTLQHAHIDVVEPDALLDTIAERYFGLRAERRLRIIHTDGLSFLKTNIFQYDAIFIDAFDGLEVPASLTNMQALRYLRKGLRKGGLIAMNVVTKLQSREMRSLHRLFASVFKNVFVYPADPKLPPEQSQNFIILVRNSAIRPGRSVRVASTSAPVSDPAIHT
jgi:spermidine synthase